MQWEIGEYQLAEGATAIITHVQPQSKRPYVGMIRKANGELKACDWDANGFWSVPGLSILHWDLPGAVYPLKIQGFCNVYRTEGVLELGPLHDSIEDAKSYGADGSLAIVPIEVLFYEGQNL